MTSINFDYVQSTKYTVISETHQDLCDEDLALLQTESKTKRVSMCSNATNYCMEIQSLTSSKSYEGYNKIPFSGTTTICNGVLTSTDTKVDERSLDDTHLRSIFDAFLLTEGQSVAIMDSMISTALLSGNLISSPNSDIVGLSSIDNNGDVITIFIDKVNRTSLGYTVTDPLTGKINTKVELNYKCENGKLSLFAIITKRCLISPICEIPVLKTTKVNIINLQKSF